MLLAIFIRSKGNIQSPGKVSDNAVDCVIAVSEKLDNLNSELSDKISQIMLNSDNKKTEDQSSQNQPGSDKAMINEILNEFQIRIKLSSEDEVAKCLKNLETMISSKDKDIISALEKAINMYPKS